MTSEICLRETEAQARETGRKFQNRPAELKRCCMCLPLRQGLIAFGYIKLILGLSLTIITSYAIATRLTYSHVSTESILVIVVFLLILVLDVCLTTVFLVGGHRKSAKLLHVYYIYNIVDLVIYVLFFTWNTVTELIFWGQMAEYLPSGYANLIPIVQVKLLFGIGYIGIQIYITLLVRSEVIKLRNKSKFRFTNLQTETERIENGSNKQGTDETNETTNENGIDHQFQGIINQTKESDQTNFTYKKF